MKISIDVEVAEHEIPLANELLATLRALTDQVRVRTTSGGAPSAPVQRERSPAPAPASAPAASAPAAAPSGAAAPPPVGAAATRNKDLHDTLTRRFGSLSVAAATSSDIRGLTAAALAEALRVLGVPSPEAAAALDAATTADVANELVAAVCTLLSDPEMGQRLEAHTASVAPVVTMGTLMPDTLRTAFFKALAVTVIWTLNNRRPPGTLRMTVFGLSEVFARLVEVGHLPIAGAVTTIVKLLQTAEKRVAAVTMLGKTVEVCFAHLTERCEPGPLAALHDALHALTEPEYQYDVEYVSDCLGWNAAPPPGATYVPGSKAAAVAPPPAPALAPSPPAPPAPPPAAAAAQQPPIGMALGPDARTQLVPLRSHLGRPGSVYALAVDPDRGEVFAAVTSHDPATEDVTQVFGERGLVAEIKMGGNMCAVMDVIRPVSVLLAATMPKAPGSSGMCTVRCFAPGNDGGEAWAEAGALSRPDAKPLSALRALPTTANGFSFALGETQKGPDGRNREVVAVYDLNTAQTFSSLASTQLFVGHEHFISTLEASPMAPTVLFSGSKDSTIRLWDRRVPNGGGLLVGQAAPGGGVAPAHRDMITALAARDYSLMSSSMDRTVVQWDLRTIGTGAGHSTVAVAAWRPDDQPAIKVALAPGAPCAAVSTLGGLYSLDVGGSAQAAQQGGPPPPPKRAAAFADRPPGPTGAGRYHGLVWHADRALLYGAFTSNDLPQQLTPSRLDVYTVIA